MTGSLQSFYFSELSTLNLLQFFDYNSYFLTMALVPQGDSLYSLIGLCNLRGNVLPCDLISLMDLRSTADFSVC